MQGRLGRPGGGSGGGGGGSSLWSDGTVSTPGARFQNDQNNGVYKVTSVTLPPPTGTITPVDYWALSAGGRDAIRIWGESTYAPFAPRVAMGNIGEPGPTDKPENLFHIHYSGSAASNGVVGIVSSITDDASAARALPSVIPDPSAGSFILAQTSALATGAGRAVEAHAIRAVAGSAGGTWMIHESGIHTGTAGNWGSGISGVPLTIGYWLSSYADAVMTGLGVSAVPADVGLYINEGFGSGTAGGFTFPIAYQRFITGSIATAFYMDRSGNLAVGTNNNAALVGYGFVGDTETGMFWGGNDVLAFSAGGTERGRFTTTEFQIAANLTLSGSSRRVLADYSNATVATRTQFQSSTTNGATRVGAIPNGTGTAGAFEAHNNATPASGTVARIEANATDVRLESLALGGSSLPLTFRTAGAEAARIDTSGNLGVGVTATAGSRIHASGGYIRAGGGFINEGAQIEKSITPTTLVANTNNYAPTGGSAASIIQVSASTPINITGLNLSQSIAGHRVTLYNGGGSTITLTHADAASSTANQFVSDTGSNYSLVTGKSKSMFWNGVWWILLG